MSTASAVRVVRRMGHCTCLESEGCSSSMSPASREEHQMAGVPTGGAPASNTANGTEERALDRVRKALYIGGEWRQASGAGTLSVEDPSTGEPFAEVADATPDDALAALAAAADVQGEWAATAPRERGEILRRAYELLLARAEELALVMTLEMGKPLGESRAELNYAAEFLRWFSEEAVRIHGRYMT